MVEWARDYFLNGLLSRFLNSISKRNKKIFLSKDPRVLKTMIFIQCLQETTNKVGNIKWNFQENLNKSGIFAF